jgi:hypothetical protein
VELHLPGLRVVQRDAGVIVLNGLAQRLRDLAEHARIVELGDQQVVHVEQQLQAVPMVAELTPVAVYAVHDCGVLDRDRQLARHLL